MKTTTIYSAMNLAHWRLLSKHIPVTDKRIRQYDKFYTAFHARLEEGDRAREALKVFADDNSWNFNNGIYEFDLGVIFGEESPEWASCNPMTMAQIALDGKP